MLLRKKYTNKSRFLKNLEILKKANLLEKIEREGDYYIIVYYPH